MKIYITVVMLFFVIISKAQTNKISYAFLDTFNTGFFVENIGKWYKLKETDFSYIRFKYIDTLGSCFFKFYYNDTLQFRGCYQSSIRCLGKKDTFQVSDITAKDSNSINGSNPFSGLSPNQYEYYPRRHGKWAFYRNNKIYKTIVYKDGIIISQN